MSQEPDEDFDRGIICEKLPDHVACCRIKDGSNIYYQQADRNKLYTESKSVSRELLPEHPLQFAGEVDNVLYFYTKMNKCESGRGNFTKYTFYYLLYDRNSEPEPTITFQETGIELTNETEPNFALQQPYYYQLDESTGNVIIKNFEGKKVIHLTGSNSDVLTNLDNFTFIIWNGKAIIIKRNDIKGTEVTREFHYDDGQLCVIAVQNDLPSPKSILTRERLYLLCGATLFVFDPHLSYKVYTIGPPCYRIGGVEGSRRLYLNAPCRFFSHDLPGRYQSAELDQVRKEEAKQLKETLEKLKKLEASAKTCAPFDSKFSSEYEVKDILGFGSGGCVFGAVNKWDKIKYAVKRIAVDPRSIEMALEEARIMAGFEHASIVRYNSTWVEKPPWGWQYDSDSDMLTSLSSNAQQEYLTFLNYSPGSHFMYIQMQRGDYSLTSWLNNNRTKQSRNLESMKEFFRQIVSGVDHIHEKGFIHRDLKPCNILFFDGGRLKICDMGIAVGRKMLPNGKEKTTSYNDAKTTLYMSPEQMTAIPHLKANSDVFTLGLIFAELCIIMEYEQREKIFDNYRNGRPRENIAFYSEDIETAKFVASLSAYDTSERPCCSDILREPYLNAFGG